MNLLKRSCQNEYHIVIGLMDSTAGQITTSRGAANILHINILLVMYTNGRGPVVTFHFLRIFFKGLFLEKKTRSRALVSVSRSLTGGPCAMLSHHISTLYVYKLG